MSRKVEFRLNSASQQQIAEHLSLCDAGFVPPLSSRVEIENYARKISSNAVKFEAWMDESLVGLVALYCNDAGHRLAYITNVSVLGRSRGKRIASHLIERCIEYLRDAEFETVELEVDKDNTAAVRIYERYGFLVNKSDGRTVAMRLDLGRTSQ
jgi:ribosomal protein S18 acetylase RimI-like enzyme